MNLIFFTDRDLGTRFPDILSAAGLKVERHRDHFPPECADEEWLRTIGSRAWIAVSQDRRIRYKPNEFAAVVRHRVALFVVVGKAPFPQLARHFVPTVPRIAKFLAGHTPPLIAKVYRPLSEDLAKDPDAPGTVALWYPKPGKARNRR